MNKALDKMQEKLSPIAMKVGNQRFLVALRDSFVGTMPVITIPPRRDYKSFPMVSRYQ